MQKLLTNPIFCEHLCFYFLLVGSELSAKFQKRVDTTGVENCIQLFENNQN